MVLVAPLLLVLLTLPPSTVAAAAPEWSLRDYIQTVWTHHDGRPLAQLRQITQTTDGYLWILTRGGDALLRFDGMRFTPVPLPLPCDGVNSVQNAGDGGLWLLCGDRVFRRTAQSEYIELRMPSPPLNGRNTHTIYVDSRGRLWWLNGLNGFIARLQADGTFLRISRQTVGPSQAVAEDSEGRIWIAGATSVLRVSDDKAEIVHMGDVRVLARGATSGMLARVFSRGDTGPIWHLTGTSKTLFARAADGIDFGDWAAVDLDGGLWIATRQHGLALVRKGSVETLPAAGEMGGLVTDVFVDREGTTWAGSSAGLHRFRKPRVQLISAQLGRVTSYPRFAYVDSRDDLWAGLFGYGVIRTNPATHMRQVVVGRYNAIAEDGNGRIWLAAAGDIGVVKDGAFLPVRDVAGAAVRNVFTFRRDEQGHLWALAEGVGLYEVTPGPPRRVIEDSNAASDFLVSARHGIWTETAGGIRQHVTGRPSVFHDTRQLFGVTRFASVQTIYEDGDSIWMGGQPGLLRWRNGQWTRWTREHGLPGSGGVYEIIADRFGRFWMMTNGGIIAVARAQLDAAADGAPTALEFGQIGTLDRVLPHTGPPKESPRVSVDSRGRLYFATMDSLAVVDPATFVESQLKPSIVIESLSVDNQPVDMSLDRRYTEPSRLEFEYTSLSLRSPENIRFRYKLEGYDGDWIEAGGQRSVTYGTLKPGPYRFRVIGSGSEGVRNDEGATLAFQIVPLFWNTSWFRFTVVAFIALTIAGVYRFRVRTLTRHLNMRFEERLSERTRIARDLHDTLLQETLAASFHLQVANDALANDVPSPQDIDEARAPLTRAVQLLAHAAQEGRATLQGLRTGQAPADLAEAFYQSARDQPNHGDIDFRVIVEGSARPLNPQVSDEICRIAREAICNAYQHSRARHIEVELAYTRDHFRCIVRDDGVGMDQRVIAGGRDGHWGLTGMRERAEHAGALLHLRSSPSAGTEVDLAVKASASYLDLPSPTTRSHWWRTRPPNA